MAVAFDFGVKFFDVVGGVLLFSLKSLSAFDVLFDVGHCAVSCVLASDIRALRIAISHARAGSVE